MTYTNPIPIWLSTTIRQITDKYSDSHGGRCAVGVLVIPKYASEDIADFTATAFGFKDTGLLIDLNDEKGLSFVEIAQKVQRNLERYFVPAAIKQFREEERIARELGSIPLKETVTVQEAL